MTKIAVTAASGQLGSAVVRELVRTIGDGDVVGLARTPDKAKSLGVEIRPGDYAEPEQLLSSLYGVKSLLLVSGMDSPDKRVGLHRNVIQAARQAGVARLVYTSIQGAETGTGFSPVVQSNRQTEADVRNSGLDWVVGRNGIYIEPDVDYMETYRKYGEIANCAGDAKCGYTTRDELAFAYSRMLSEPLHSRQTYNLHGEAITQFQLAMHLNRAFGTNLRYREMSVEAFLQDRTAELGEFLGTIIAGIYEGIRKGAVCNVSRFHEVARREHQSWNDYFADLRV